MVDRGLAAHLRQTDIHFEASLTAVLAHETAHILQGHSADKDELAAIHVADREARRIELHADFFSGYYTGLLKLADVLYPAALVPLTHYDLGDNDLQNKQHHGTPQERAAAVLAGFTCSYSDSKPLAEAQIRAMQYIRALPVVIGSTPQ